MKQDKRGFTLIELLVVIAIIGVLAGIVLVSLNTARARGRDAKRISDVKQIQTALELFFNDQNPTAYPTAAVANFNATYYLCNTAAGWSTTACASGPTYITVNPAPTPPDGTCTADQNAYDYATTASGYSMTFCLGAATGGLGAGLRTATESGIQ
jgi:prepilin-type N-terminal cleavage/methylation domain-containing protein